MNLLAGKRDPLDFFLLALRSGYFFFPGKLIVNHKTLKRYQLAGRKRNKAFLKIWSLSTPDSYISTAWKYTSCMQANTASLFSRKQLKLGDGPLRPVYTLRFVRPIVSGRVGRVF